MADEEIEAMFDPTMKKKKKKKTKTPFDLDAALDGSDSPKAQTEVGETQETEESNETPKEEKTEEEEKPKGKDIMDDLDLEDFTKMKKKKKKKKTGFDMEGLGEALPDPDAQPEPPSEEVSETPVSAVADDIEDFDEDFTAMKKKKKKKRKIIDNLENNENGDLDDNAENDDAKEKAGIPWAGSERDYTYDELLNRVFDIMRAKNPDMVTGEKKRFILKPPQVVRNGTKKSSFVNFSDICRMLHRQPEHLLAFLLAELGTSGSIDGQNMLVIKGRFQQKQIESVLRRYIKEYVTCHTCRSSDTILHKENRLFFLQCESCQSRCSVASIKSGFQAVTKKRAQMRAKNN